MSENDESVQTAEAEPREIAGSEPVVPASETPEPNEPNGPDAALEPEAAGSPPAFELPLVAVAEQSPDGGLAEAAGAGLTWIPYAVYLGAWLVLSGVTAFLLKDATAADLLGWRALPASGPIVWTGVGLTALGPVLSLVVWLVARRRRPAGSRRGLLVSALIRGALTAVFGVVIWVVTLQVLELAARGAFS